WKTAFHECGAGCNQPIVSLAVPERPTAPDDTGDEQGDGADGFAEDLVAAERQPGPDPQKDVPGDPRPHGHHGDVTALGPQHRRPSDYEIKYVRRDDRP